MRTQPAAPSSTRTSPAQRLQLDALPSKAGSGVSDGGVCGGQGSKQRVQHAAGQPLSQLLGAILYSQTDEEQVFGSDTRIDTSMSRTMPSNARNMRQCTSVN